MPKGIQLVLEANKRQLSSGRGADTQSVRVDEMVDLQGQIAPILGETGLLAAQDVLGFGR